MSGEPVLLSEVARRIGGAAPMSDVPILEVHHDSRAVVPGSLFVAIPGERHDGHDFIPDAVARGAVAVLVDHEIDTPVPTLQVADTRAALAGAAAAVHRDPGKAISMAAVTGTDGKTTVAHMVHAVARSTGRRAGLLGTLGATIAGRHIDLERTTPEASDIQRLLGEMADAGVTVCVMEVSSHSLVLHRVDEIPFRVAGFTNLSQDHLDFHSDMEAYFDAKAALFTGDRTDVAVVAVDSDWGRRLAALCTIPVVTVGRSPDAMIRAVSVDGDLGGSRFSVVAPGGEAEVTLSVPGRFNVDNALVAIGLCLELGFSLEEVVRGLSALPVVRGRFEVVPGPWPSHVVVDYAHTPRAVASIISEVRALQTGRIVAVLGAGGDRDREKRPLMGRAAAAADLAVITSDNPRSEDPAMIVSEVAAGAAATELVTEVDRTAAIELALAAAGPGDVVLILGKGHEPGQEFAGGRVEPYDDREAARSAWAALQAKGVAP